MSKVTMDKLYILYVLKTKQGPSDNDNIFLALNTISYDSSKEIFTKTFREGDALQKCVALHSICAKLSYVIMEASESGNYPIMPVIHAHTIFGTNEPGEMLNVSCISKKLNINSKCNIDEKVDICISIVNLNEEPEAVYIIDFINDKGQAVRREEGIISDYSLIIITKSILEYFSNHTYINKL